MRGIGKGVASHVQTQSWQVRRKVPPCHAHLEVRCKRWWEIVCFVSEVCVLGWLFGHVRSRNEACPAAKGTTRAAEVRGTCSS